MIKEIKEIEKLENYVINNSFELGDLLNDMQVNCDNGYTLSHDELEMMLNYIALLQKLSIKYMELKELIKGVKNGKDKNYNLYK